MFDYLSSNVWRLFAIVLIATSLYSPSIQRPGSQTNQRVPAKGPGISLHGDEEHEGKKGLTREQQLKEVWARHAVNVQRLENLEKTNQLGLPSRTTDFTNTDTGDISVIQADPRLVIPADIFDLNAQTVTFTPSGAGYTITSGAGVFDNNLGTKLDLTTAVCPFDAAVPGDDCYTPQSIGFNFPYYGSNYSSVAVSSNGKLTFQAGGFSQIVFDQLAASSTPSIAEFQGGPPSISAYWADLLATASETVGSGGVYIRRDVNRVLISWNTLRDFPPPPPIPQSVHTFQISLFNDGRIVIVYSAGQLTTQALAGISPGLTNNTTTLVNLNAPPAGTITSPIAEFFSTTTMVDYISVIQAFYVAHPARDVYDFLYMMTDFDINLDGAFAFYLPIRNNDQGTGQDIFDGDPGGPVLGAQNIQGFLNLSNLASDYPAFPTTRFLGANHGLSIMGQEQGHRWLFFPAFPGPDPLLLLGRDDAHGSFYLNNESTISSSAARRSSSSEANVWRDNGNGTFTSVNLIDGYSRLDQYLMGLRPATDVPDTFVIANPFNTTRTRASNPFPNVTVSGARQNVSITQIVQANGARVPSSATAKKNFRAATVLLVQQGTQPTAATLNKVARYRLAWESYFAQSTDYIATINTGLADQTVSRVIAGVSAASYVPTLAPAEIGSIFGTALTNNLTQSATSAPLPTTLAGVQVLINGVPTGLFYASPGQINFQVPRTTAAVTTTPQLNSTTALIEILRDGQLIRAGAFQIGPTVPAIFTLNSSGSGPAAAVDAFTGAGAPFNARQANGQPNFISVFGTGLGADATDIAGNVNGSVQASLDGVLIAVDYAGTSPGFVGLNQLNIILPANIAPGTHTLIISRNGIQAKPVTIATR